MKTRHLVFGLIIVCVLFFSGCGGEQEEGSMGNLFKKHQSWEGFINIQGQKLGFAVHFAAGEILSAKMDIPIQGARGLDLENVTWEPPKIHFELPATIGRAVWDGTVSGETITGNFAQGGALGKFELSPAAEKSAEDEPVYGEEVLFETPLGALHGRLVVPEGEGPFPVAVIIAGSGPTDGDGNAALIPGKNNSLKMVARALEEAGIASLRYDKRGIGRSGGIKQPESELVFEDLIGDAAGFVSLLRRDNRFSSVGIIGHSEGALVGLMVAQKDADFYVSVAGMGMPFHELILVQLANLPEGLKNESIRIIESLKQGEMVDQVSSDLMALFRPSVQPYLISVFKYNPAVEIGKLSIPVLILQGTVDLQIKVKDAELLSGGNTGARVVIIENMNHVLKRSSADTAENSATYSNPDLPLHEEFVSELTGFVKGF